MTIEKNVHIKFTIDSNKNAKINVESNANHFEVLQIIKALEMQLLSNFNFSVIEQPNKTIIS